MIERYNEMFIDNVSNNIIGSLVLNDAIPEGILIDNIDYFPYNLEFKSLIKFRRFSSFFETLLSDYSVFDVVVNKYTISNEGMLLLINVIKSRFTDKWTKLRDLWNLKYDPLSPFDITLNEKTTNELNVNEDVSESSSNDSIYGFNSVEKVPTDSSINRNENKYSRSNPTSRDYTRKGNIGNTSRQELVEQEREVLKYQLIDTIYNDIASVICRGKYY